MKILFVSVLIAVLTGGVSTQGIAQTPRIAHHHHAVKNTSTAAETPMVVGVVKKINRYTGRVTLFHGPLPNGVPPMTTAYRVKDDALLDEMKVGQKIRFATDPLDGGNTVLRIEPAN